MLKEDKQYRISVLDERLEKIRDKVNSTMTGIFMFSNILIGIVALILKENVSSILIFGLVFISPIIMYFISRFYENKI